MYYHNPHKPASAAQVELLREMGVEFNGWPSSAEANELIKQNYDRWAILPPTLKQRQVLESNFCWREGMTRREAAEWIAKLTGKNVWPLRKPERGRGGSR